LASNHKSKQLILDFHVRWNTTFLMLKRFVELKSQIDEITHKVEKIIGITSNKVKSIKKLEIKYDEWEIIEDIIKVLKPFYESTVILSSSRLYC